MQKRQRPDAAKMAEDLFSKLDSTGKGYIEQSDLSSALSSLDGTSGSTSSASEIFSQLDGDSDGKVTKDELSATLQKLSESLDNQFNQMRMEGAMPPPPPPSGQAQASDDGFTEEELNSQLSEIGSTDSARSSLISKVVQNFDAADTNEDGKVSFAEAMAYDQSNPTASSTSTDSTSTTTSNSVASTEQSDAKVFRQLMDLLRTYGSDDRSSQSAAATLLSVSA
jgi:Ca2+-binding EF-hand superfamily protein